MREIIKWAGVDDSDIVYINFCYKYAKIYSLKKKQEKYTWKLMYLKYYRKMLEKEKNIENASGMYPPPSFSWWKFRKVPHEKEESINQKLNEVNKRLAVMKGVRFGGVAFVVFKNQKSVGTVWKFYSRGGICGFVLRTIYPIFCCWCYKWSPWHLSQYGKVVKVSHAPEPNDIYWQNICKNKWWLYMMRAISYFIIACLLVASYFVNNELLKWS